MWKWVQDRNLSRRLRKTLLQRLQAQSKQFYIMKILLLKYAWLLPALLLMSCEPQNLEIPATELVIIEPGNMETYLFSNLEDPAAGWVEKANGENYSFTENNGLITLISDKPMQQVIYRENTMDKEGQLLPVKGNEVESPITENGLFEIEY